MVSIKPASTSHISRSLLTTAMITADTMDIMEGDRGLKSILNQSRIKLAVQKKKVAKSNSTYRSDSESIS